MRMQSIDIAFASSSS